MHQELIGHEVARLRHAEVARNAERRHAVERQPRQLPSVLTAMVARAERAARRALWAARPVRV